MSAADAPDSVLLGTAALGRRDWTAARGHFETALAEADSAGAREGMSWAAWWLNDAEGVIQNREAAYRLYRQTGDAAGAARMAMWAGCDYADFRGEMPIAQGWLSRARRLLDAVPTCEEHGWLRVLEGELAGYLDDMDAAERAGADAIAVGRAIGHQDIEIVGLSLEGLAQVGQGRADEGMKRLDEAAASVLGGELTDDTWATKVFCYLIYACERIRDFGRAAQWCEKMREAADRLQLTFAQGICRTHYAGVLISRGHWAEAEAQLADATETLRRTRPACAVEGVVRLAELRRRQGRFDEAADAFREAEWHPSALLGLAEIALDRGRPRDAADLLDRLLRQVPESSRLQRAAALELRVRVEALLGEHGRAGATLAEAQRLSDGVSTPPLRASASFSAGLLASAARDFDTARARLEDAVDLFEKSATPYEAARARLELASVLVSLERPERARAEAESARAALEALGSVFFTRRAAALLEDLDRRARAANGQSTPLTPRQVQILRLISRGLSDREIAVALELSEHTVHRHVSNILLRLDVPTRAAAAARAATDGAI